MNINSKDQAVIRMEIDRFLINLRNKYDYYINTEQITNEVMNSIVKNTISEKNRCIVCLRDIGISNPRQLCGKTYCNNE